MYRSSTLLVIFLVSLPLLAGCLEGRVSHGDSQGAPNDDARSSASEGDDQNFVIPSVRHMEIAQYGSERYEVEVDDDLVHMHLSARWDAQEWVGSATFDRESRGLLKLEIAEEGGPVSFRYHGSSGGLIAQLIDMHQEDVAFALPPGHPRLNALLVVPFTGIELTEDPRLVRIGDEEFSLWVLDRDDGNVVVAGEYRHVYHGTPRFFRVTFDDPTAFPKKIDVSLQDPDEWRAHSKIRTSFSPGEDAVGFGDASVETQACLEASRWDKVPYFSSETFGFSTETAKDLLDSSDEYRQYVHEHPDAILARAVYTKQVNAEMLLSSRWWLVWSDGKGPATGFTATLEHDHLTGKTYLENHSRRPGNSVSFRVPVAMIDLDDVVKAVQPWIEGEHVDVALSSHAAASYFSGMRISAQGSYGTHNEESRKEWAFHPVTGCRLLDVTY